MRKKHYISLVLFGLSCFLYYLIAYRLLRTDTHQLLLAESGLFAIYFYWLKSHSLSTGLSLPKRGIGRSRFYPQLYGIIFRLIFLFSIPPLSDDVYRFIWDGQLLLNGMNPFRYLPSELQGTSFFEINQQLFTKLNSPNYYSVYPPLNQLFFWIASFFSFGNEWLNIILLRGAILAAEFGILSLFSVILHIRGVRSAFHRQAIRVEAYWLNPLVIIELTGNLHFEAVVIFFLVLMYYLLRKQKNNWAAVAFSAAVLTKLLPLIFLPLIFSYLGSKKSIKFGLIVIGICVSAGAIFFDIPLLLHLLSSVKLYFNNFEFNASIYYILREIGYSLVGYNIIGLTGKLLSVVSFFLILFISFTHFPLTFRLSSLSMKGQERNIQQAGLILSSYLFLATTVHPWYITPLIAFSALGGLQFPLVWSALIPFTYLAYRQIPFHENLWVVLAEYVIVVIFFVGEIGVSSISPTKKAKK